MKILLDSHVFVWFVLGDARCTATARDLIERSEARVFVSAATAWELATKMRMSKWPEVVPIVRDMAAIIPAYDFVALPISVEHARVAGLFPVAHKDPFDRMLAAQSQVEAMPLVTADRALDAFDIETMW